MHMRGCIQQSVEQGTGVSVLFPWGGPLRVIVPFDTIWLTSHKGAQPRRVAM